MASIQFGDKQVQLSGELPEVGFSAPDFFLRKLDMNEVTLQHYKGTRLILNIFPSIDTGVCATSVRKFNEKASSLANTKVLCISRDLPMAQKRFCGAEGIENVEMLSDFRYGSFGEAYGVLIEEGPFAGLHARAIVVINEGGNVVYTELVPVIGNEPDYESAINALNG